MLHRVRMTQALVIEYQDAWPAQYAQVEAELRSVIALPGVVLEHVGSTAVPGLCSKPVLDIVLGVVALDEMETAAPALAHIGFIYRPEYQLQIPDRRYFVRAEGKTPRVHLHAVVLGGPLWRQHLRFRDALREDQELRQSYAELKRRLAVVHMADKAAYTEAKAPFIRQVLGIPDQRGPQTGSER
jgi:GrpB-like predicted nucleotidyltransferase (UPF0157 family)